MKRARQRRLMGEINVVPYIDVMLVLLVIFMITAPLMTQGISVKLPKVSAKPLDPKLLEPLLALEGVSFVSLQRDLRDGDEQWLARHAQIRHVGSEIADLADSAAVLALCDLTIAVDTALVHLAGATGRRVWVMLPFAPDWRWVAAGDNCPWYPQARLFRQSALGDWTGIIAEIRNALARFVAEP